MALTPEEKVWIRYHLGFVGVTSIATFVLGQPAAIETQFIIESAMNLVLPESEGIVRTLIARLDNILAQMVDDHELLAIERLGEITIRKDEHNALRKEYQFWQHSLGNVFGVRPNPYDQRFLGGGINVPVIH